MNSEIRKETRTTAVAAAVGAVVAMIVSPFSQTLSYTLNSYLSRPRLSVEFVEFVEEGGSHCRLKISILNRGDSAGLIKNSAELLITLPDGSETINLHRIDPPQKIQQMTVLAVPVTVTNQPPIAHRRTAVEQIPSSSFVDMWYEVDSGFAQPTLASVSSELLSKGIARLILRDPDNKEVRYELPDSSVVQCLL